jgi:hypothetical protein
VNTRLRRSKPRTVGGRGKAADSLRRESLRYPAAGKTGQRGACPHRPSKEKDAAALTRRYTTTVCNLMTRKDADRKGGGPRYELGGFTCWDGMLSKAREYSICKLPPRCWRKAFNAGGAYVPRAFLGMYAPQLGVQSPRVHTAHLRRKTVPGTCEKMYFEERGVGTMAGWRRLLLWGVCDLPKGVDGDGSFSQSSCKLGLRGLPNLASRIRRLQTKKSAPAREESRSDLFVLASSRTKARFFASLRMTARFRGWRIRRDACCHDVCAHCRVLDVPQGHYRGPRHANRGVVHS